MAAADTTSAPAKAALVNIDFNTLSPPLWLSCFFQRAAGAISFHGNRRDFLQQGFRDASRAGASSTRPPPQPRDGPRALVLQRGRDVKISALTLVCGFGALVPQG
jgi:hypothetical protein